jgi:hypothetical protein
VNEKMKKEENERKEIKEIPKKETAQEREMEDREEEEIVNEYHCDFMEENCVNCKGGDDCIMCPKCNNFRKVDKSVKNKKEKNQRRGTIREKIKEKRDEVMIYGGKIVEVLITTHEEDGNDEFLRQQLKNKFMTLVESFNVYGWTYGYEYGNEEEDEEGEENEGLHVHGMIRYNDNGVTQSTYKVKMLGEMFNDRGDKVYRKANVIANHQKYIGGQIKKFMMTREKTIERYDYVTKGGDHYESDESGSGIFIIQR